MMHAFGIRLNSMERYKSVYVAKGVIRLRELSLLPSLRSYYGEF